MRQLGCGALVLVLGGWAGTGLAEELAAETEITVEPKTGLALALGYGGPLGVSATGELLHGLSADVRDERDRVKAIGGLLVQLRAGSGGGGLSLGVGARTRIETNDVRGGAAAGLLLSLARTWRSPAGTDGGTYLGPELDLSVMRVGLRLGTLWRIHGSGARVRFSWGVGVRL